MFKVERKIKKTYAIQLTKDNFEDIKKWCELLDIDVTVYETCNTGIEQLYLSQNNYFDSNIFVDEGDYLVLIDEGECDRLEVYSEEEFNETFNIMDGDI